MSVLHRLSGSNLPSSLGTTPSFFSDSSRAHPPLSSLVTKEREAPRPRSWFSSKPSTSDEVSLKEKAKEEIKSRLCTALVQMFDLKELAQRDPAEAREEVFFTLSPCLPEMAPSLCLAEQKAVLEEICDTLLGYGPLEALLQRPEVSRIFVNGPSSAFIEVDGKMEKTAVRFANAQQLLHVCRRLLHQVGLASKSFNRISEERFPDGTRIHVVLPPLSVDGPALTLHRAHKIHFGFEELITIGTLSPQVRGLLEALRAARTNILISGGRSSGKTTLVNCLLEGIGPQHPVIVCGEAVGCDMRRPNVVYFEPRPRNFDGEGQVTMQDLVQNSLRLRPTYLVVDQLRGREALDLLQGMSAGHQGSIATLMADSPQEALSCVEQMILTTGWLPLTLLRPHIAKLFPIIVQTCQLEDGSRKVTSVVEVSGLQNNEFQFKTLFSFEAQGKDKRGKIVGEFHAASPNATVLP